MSGGLIRFYNVKFFLSGGKRKNGFNLRPVPKWANINSTYFQHPYYGGTIPELRIVNCEFAGNMINLFNKSYAGVANLIVTNCRTNYFNCDEIFETYSNPATNGGPGLGIPAPSMNNPPSDNWLGWGNGSSVPYNIIDNRWNHQYSPFIDNLAKTWPANPVPGLTDSYYNGYIDFSGNSINGGLCNINYNKVDLTKSNSTAQSNIINGNINIVYPSNTEYIIVDGDNRPYGALNGNSSPNGYYGRPSGTSFLFIDTTTSPTTTIGTGNINYIDLLSVSGTTKVNTFLSNSANKNYLNQVGATYSIGVIPNTNNVPAAATGKFFIGKVPSPTPPPATMVGVFRTATLKYRP